MNGRLFFTGCAASTGTSPPSAEGNKIRRATLAPRLAAANKTLPVTQEGELTALRGELDNLHSENAFLASALAELKASDQARGDRLARLESSLEKVSARDN